jgi:aspartate/methionine/tyrosine aminotransferase
MKQWLDKHQDIFEVNSNELLNYCFPRVKEGIDVDELVSLLIDKYKVLIAPGKFFGDHVKDHVRIGWAYFSKNELVEGLEKFDMALEEII